MMFVAVANYRSMDEGETHRRICVPGERGTSYERLGVIKAKERAKEMDGEGDFLGQCCALDAV